MEFIIDRTINKLVNKKLDFQAFYGLEVIIINSFISWVGGKSLSREYILARFPLNYERYIECFMGGAWIYFSKKPEPFEVINDYNNNLYNLYSTVKYRPASFLKELGILPMNARKEFFVLLNRINGNDQIVESFIEEEMEVIKEFEQLEMAELINLLYAKDTDEKEKNQDIKMDIDVKRAVAFYKVIRYSYASGCSSFASQPYNIKSCFDQIWNANKRLNDNGYSPFTKGGNIGNGTIIENKDFESLIKQYDREGSFFYCDPPYYEAEGCYQVAFSEDDHIRLRNVLSNIKGKFLLSYNDHPYIRELYKDFNIEGFERLNTISQRYDAGGMYGELLISNYDMNERRNGKRQLSLLDI